MQADRLAADRDRVARSLKILLHLLVVAVALGVFEWLHRPGVPPGAAPAHRTVEALLLWALVAKSLAFLSPTLIIAFGLAQARWSRAAWVVSLVGTIVTVLWLVTDLRVKQWTGARALDYLAFMVERSPLEWAGGAGELLAPFLGVAAPALLLVLTSAWGSAVVVDRLLRPSLRFRSAVLGGLVLLHAGLVVGVAPFLRNGESSLVMRQLEASLPVSLPMWAGRSLGRDELLTRLNLEVSLQYRRDFARIVTPPPLDDMVTLPGPPGGTAARPNVLLIVVESLRAQAFEQGWMPRLTAWAAGGMRFDRHYANSNSSQAGLFALLYGRHPLLYTRTLDAGVLPQLPHTLRQSGYSTAYLMGSAVRWQRLEEFVNERVFDRLVLTTTGEWPDRDRRTIAAALELLRQERARPWFLTLFLVSSHYPYIYPPRFELHRPTPEPGSWLFVSPTGAVGPAFRDQLLNRYRNSLAFLDDLIAGLLEAIEGTDSVVIVTGDHGESFNEDGTWVHLGPLSEVQTRVPLVLRAPGVPTGAHGRASSHVDVLPTILHAIARGALPIRHVHGRDLLMDDWADQALLSKPDRPPRVVFVRDTTRADIRIDLDAPDIAVVGFADEHDRPTVAPSGLIASGWTEAFGAELRLLAR
jgi:phosphoglycerol transferase MdoB-like AlkP superfamily enzyme